ncbi:MAG: PAS domain-containing protein [Mucilaginibacter sp.]|uniref:PAS domain-containing protein n=1 Tax=Mucilaginibacter sp. TaxID=1882438 RepID=UPI003263D783
MELCKAQTFNNALCLSFSNKEAAASLLNNKQVINKLQSDLNGINFKYNAVFNSADSYYIILDKHLNIVDYNYASLRLIKNVFGKTLIIGEHIGKYLNDELSDSVLANCTRALSGETFTVERKITFCATGISWWQANYSPAYNEHQHIAGIVFNAVDITARKAREAKIESQNQKLKDISLVHSHDIRGPLCTLMGLMELIKLEGLGGDSRFLAMMDDTITLLDRKIRDIVAYASGE